MSELKKIVQLVLIIVLITFAIEWLYSEQLSLAIEETISRLFFIVVAAVVVRVVRRFVFSN